MVKLNPEIVDQEKIRHQRRRRLLKMLVAPSIIVALVGFYLLRTGIYNISYNFLYSNQDYDNAKGISELQNVANVITPFLTHYNIGVVQLRKNRLEEAEASFRESLKKSPPKDKLCMVYVNLSLSIELQADKLRDNKKFEEAISLYNTAEAILYENNCASRALDGTNKDQAAQDAKKRIIDKRVDTLSEKNELDSKEEPSGGSGGNEGRSDGEIMTPKDYEIIKGYGNQSDILNGIYKDNYRNSGVGRSRSYGSINW